MASCVCVCGGSAVEFWRIWRLLGTRGLRGLGVSASRDFIRSHRDAAVGGGLPDFGMPDLCVFEGLAAGQVAFLSTPVEFLASAQEADRELPQLRLQPVPSGLSGNEVVRVSERLYVTAPATSLAWVARRHGVIGLLRLLYEFCGCYAVDLGRPAGFKGVGPLVTWGELYELGGGGAGARGAALLRRLLPFVAEECASPVQAAVIALLCLPPSMGGVGLPLPEANRPVLPGDQATPVRDGCPYVVDAVWEWAKAVVEYDSGAGYPGVHTAPRHSARRLALEARGYRVVGLAGPELADEDLFLGAALELAARLGVPVSRERLGAGWPARHRLLRKELLCGVGAWRASASESCEPGMGEGRPTRDVRPTPSWTEPATVRASRPLAAKWWTNPPMVRAHLF